MYRFLILLMMVCTAIACGYSETQTDWSQGAGVTGPVLQFGNQFRHDTDVIWSVQPGVLSLWNAAEHVVDDDFYNANEVYSEDIDGDGDMDILGAARYGYEISWWENQTGSGDIWVKHPVVQNLMFPYSVFAEDMDSDGDMDILGSAQHTSRKLLAWWENDGSGGFPIEHEVDTTSAGVRSLVAVDMDGDMDFDITGAVHYNSMVAWWENTDGSGTSWSKHIIGDNIIGPQSAYPVDLDNDGDLDIIAAAKNGDEIVWWENMDGVGGIWSEKHIIAFAIDYPLSVHAADLDSDGDMDVLGAASEAECINWWENIDGQGGTWMEHQIVGDYYGACSVYAIDLDQDGDPDVLSGKMFGDEVAWWENIDGLGTAWGKHDIDRDFDYVHDVYAEDINGDGSPDILGAAGNDNLISWWDIQSYSPVGLLESSILDTQSDTDWDYLDWNSETPSGTSVSFQVRSSDDYMNMGVWSDTIFTPCSLEGILTEGDLYVQYRAVLETSDSDTTPTLNDITISWNLLGIGETAESIHSGTMLFPIIPNPAAGAPVVRFGLAGPALVEISIFDLSGRLVTEIDGDEYSQGYHDVLLGEWSPGIYFCRMTSGEFSATQRFVVIE